MPISLTASPPRATAVAQQSGFFDQRRLDCALASLLAMWAMTQVSLRPVASTAAPVARWWRWQWDVAGATGWRWR